MLCGSFCFPPLFEQNKENNPFEMKKLLAWVEGGNWSVSKGSAQQTCEQTFLQTSPRGGGSSWAWGCWLASSGLASSCQNVPHPVVCKDSQQPNKLIPACALRALLGAVSLSFGSIGRVGVLTHQEADCLQLESFSFQFQWQLDETIACFQGTLSLR